MMDFSSYIDNLVTMADDLVDNFVSANITGKPLFYEEDGQNFVNSAILTSIVGAIGQEIMKNVDAGLNAQQTAYVGYILTALTARSRGMTLREQMFG